MTGCYVGALCVVNATTGELERNVVLAQDLIKFEPPLDWWHGSLAWNSAGTKLAFGGRSELYLVDLIGGALEHRVVVQPLNSAPDRYDDTVQVSWNT